MNEFELEQEQTRTEVATYLRKLAEGLETGDKVTFISGDNSVTINPPETLHFKLNTESDSTLLGGEEGQSIEFELGWEANEVEMDDTLTVVLQPGSSRGERPVHASK